MNRLIEGIRNVCREYLLEEKWLIAPSLRVGHQWSESVVRSGQPVVNVHVQTLKGMAIGLAGPEMARRKLTLLTAQGGALVVDSIWNCLPERVAGYLSNLQRSPSLSQSVFRSLSALRLAGLSPDDLRAGQFEVAAKAADMAQLLREYLRQLQARKLLDYADLLRLAIRRLENDPRALRSDLLVLIPQDSDPVGLEEALLSAIPASRRLEIRVDQPEADTGAPTDAGLLRWLLNPADAPIPKGDGTVSIFQAVGEANEAREVIRRCLAARHRIDQVEIIYTDTATYVPLFYEIANRLGDDDGQLAGGLPVTFAEGIPASYSRPGRALREWLNWIQDGYPQLPLVRMIHDGLLKIPGMNEQQFSFSGLAGMLRSIGIGLGHDRYLANIDEQIAALSHQAARLKERSGDGAELADQPSQATERRGRGLALLRELIGRLLDLSPRSDADRQEILDSAATFLSEMARRINELDNYAHEVLGKQIEDMKRWIKLTGEGAHLDMRTWLLELPRDARILGSGPRAGCLHVASAVSGGHSGRPYTFVLGLDDSRFPGPNLQDPILLDSERRALSSKLPRASDLLKNKLTRFVQTLGRLRGQVTLSFPCRDLADDREMFPSAALLAAFRIISGKRDGDQRALAEWLEVPASFAPNAPEKCLDNGEWWLYALCGSEPVQGARELVISRFAHLGRGLGAAEHRASARFTAYDGYVPAAGAVLNPLSADGRPSSASALETAGRCPRAYFYHYALQVRPLDELAIELDRWLDPLAFGALLHEVFRRFMCELRAEGKLPNFTRDRKRLEHILSEQIRSYHELYPPPNESLYRDQCRQLERAVRIFLMTEAEFCQRSRPLFMEASLGLAAAGNGTPLDEPDPLGVPLSDGTSVRIRGRIDRIDQLGDESSHEFAIWDYKTGSSNRYKRSDPFRQGRIIQHVLYLAMVQQVLRKTLDPKATVSTFGYFFPGVRGWGNRVAWSSDELSEGQAVLQRLCQTISSGSFAATDQCEDCRFCDYQAVCGDYQAVTAASKDKLANQENASLQSFRELRPR